MRACSHGRARLTPPRCRPLPRPVRARRGIEGAIGSIHKVDASYLSPHVNIASRMCAAAKQYGKSILMSSVFYNLLSPTAARYCRLVRRPPRALHPAAAHAADGAHAPAVRTRRRSGVVVASNSPWLHVNSRRVRVWVTRWT